MTDVMYGLPRWEAVTCRVQLIRSGGNKQNLWFLYKNMVHGIAELMAQRLGKATSFGKVTIFSC